MPRASSPKKTKAAPKMGRPTKGQGAAEHMMTVRFTDDDKALLDALVGDERARLEAHGILADSAARVAAADVLRALVRKEAQRRGLLEAPVAQAS